jgi:AraC family transcriptional regulator
VHLVRQYTSSTVGRSSARAACPAPPGLSERQIQQVLAFIRTQLGEQLSLAVLAQQIGYSPYHFARLLRRALGASSHQVVLHLRLARAQRLLEATTLPLARSAGESGFATQSSLTRVITRALGVPPVPRAPCPVPRADQRERAN